jgi:hypothetical protein
MHIHAILVRLIAVLFVGPLFLITACETTEEPIPPSRVVIVSGNQQYSKIGTALPEPLTVKVQYADLTEAQDVTVRFSTINGDGTVSRGTDTTDRNGIASTLYTLGPGTGTNTIRAELADNSAKYVDFTATGGAYFCPEEDPAYSYKFISSGTIQRDLLLFTRWSGLHDNGGEPTDGVVRLVVEGGSLRPTSFIKSEDGEFIVPHDAAFSQSGDFYLSRLDIFPEVLKVKPNKSSSVFSGLESFGGAEITRGTQGVLVGCDEYGPFIVGCRDTLQRFDEARYDGGLSDVASADAVAVDTNPANTFYEDIYFIYLSDRTLRRLPMANRVPEGSTEIVNQLTRDEAEGTKGMVCDDDGTLYLLVESTMIKAILRVTPAGVKTVEYDFFDRGSGNAAGIQNDLAIQPGINFLYTIDAFNNKLLVYDIGQGLLTEMLPDALMGYDAEAISSDRSGGVDHVGLVVLPGPSGF